jgi:competence protein ComEA
MTAFRRAAAALLTMLAAAAHALHVNTASQADLEQLRGIGVALAERVLDERAKRPFRDWADLVERVPGIGPAQAKRLSAAGLRVGDAPYPVRPSSR